MRLNTCLQEPTEARLQLEKWINTEDESIHTGYLSNGAQLVDLGSEASLQGDPLHYFIAGVGVLSIL